MSTIPLSGLARKIVNDGLLDEKTSYEAHQYAKKNNIPFVSHIVQSGLAPSLAVAKAASEEFGTPLLDITAYDTSALLKGLVDQKLITKHRCLPLYRRGNRLYIAVSDPTNLAGIDEIKFHTGVNTEVVVVEESKLGPAIEKFLDSQDSSMQVDLEEAELDVEASNDGGGVNADDDGGVAADEAPVVRFINKMLLDAIKIGASDLHFEPYEKAYRVRFRIDGILQEITRPPIGLASRFSARIKVMAQLDISERRMPQDGRMKMKISATRSIDFRVSVLPTLWGEKIVMRILDPTSAQMGIDALGYEDAQKQLYLKALEQPQGLILVTGPTGSGKTVSLYTGVNILNTVERNISTAEEPVEIPLEGVNQVNVNPKYGVTFASALRAFLRQDPDVVLVGEIRDLETAEIAIKASQTGHMVLSTLHTNSAPETLTRLRNMGVPAFNIATSVNLIIAQRLTRRLCSACKIEEEIPKETLIAEGFTEEDIASNFTVYGPYIKGCEKCNKGYKGRVGIYEVVKITPAISRIIMEEGNAITIADQARKEGFNDLRRSGLIKVMAGLTSLEEISRVTKSE
jgi:type IV pilus assembly protein PilB